MHSEITNSGIISLTGSTAPQGEHPRRQPGRGPICCGLPCSNCKLYYAAELAVCPICGCGARVSPVTDRIPPTSSYSGSSSPGPTPFAGAEQT